MKPVLNDPRTRLLLLACSLWLSACSSTGAARPDETHIKDRATARWVALINDDYASAYQYLSPGYRSSVSAAQYEKSLANKQLLWTNAEYIESDCTETICKVRISLDFALVNVLPGAKYYESNQKIEESWLLSGGEWYLVPKK